MIRLEIFVANDFPFRNFCIFAHKKDMKCIQDIYEAIENGGFTASTLQLIDEFVNDIENGSTDLPRFNQQEHSGLCKAGSALIGASVVASYAAGSLTAGGHAGSGQNVPNSWEIGHAPRQRVHR